MAGFDILSKIGEVILPKGFKNGGAALTPNFNPQQSQQAIGAPDTDSHLRDLLNERVTDEDNELIQKLMVYDPDVSAAVSAYLTLSNTEMRYLVKTPQGILDPTGMTQVQQIIMQLTYTSDYSIGFTMPKSMKFRNEQLRYMILKRGSISLEMVLDQKFGLLDARNIDTNSLEWYEKKKGYLTPKQKQNNDEIDLNIPTFFYASHRQDPSNIYTKSSFISVINTVYARLQIIGDLYDIMQIAGYPRMTIKLLEETIVKNMSEVDRRDDKKRAAFVNAVMSDVTRKFGEIKPTQPIVHTDSLEVATLDIAGGGGTGASIDVQPVIDVLNAQNQAALKSVATVLGRGASGVNTASVEAQIFSMQAAELNQPVADVWSQFLTFALRLAGSQNYVEVYFDKPEMRPPNELEPAYVQRQARLLKDLSLGIISDDEYHLAMYNRPKPPEAPELSGTNFLDAQGDTGNDPTSDTASAKTNTPQKDQPNSRQRAQSRKSDNFAKSNAVK